MRHKGGHDRQASWGNGASTLPGRTIRRSIPGAGNGNNVTVGQNDKNCCIS